MSEASPSGVSLEEVVAKHLASNEISLPLFDRTAARVQGMVQSEDFDVEEIGRLIQSDPALTGDLLRLSNSSFFGGIEKVATVRDAIMRLGMRQVVELLVLSGQRKLYRLKDPALHDFVERLWKHAVACGVGSEWLARKLELREVREQAFLAGLLHDVGKLLLLRVLDELKAEVSLPFEPSETLVQQLLDGLHPEQGYALMSQWNIPDAYGVVVRDHEKPEVDERNVLLNIVRLVDKACNKLGVGLRGVEDLSLAAQPEAQNLRISAVLLAELEIHIEDAMELAG
ncbi:MAG: HDOD domain-containing protein [Myxococcota bacterium]|nr:HDOD domain-containing protein [Myxococcota bacterium]